MTVTHNSRHHDAVSLSQAVRVLEDSHANGWELLREATDRLERAARALADAYAPLLEMNNPAR